MSLTSRKQLVVATAIVAAATLLASTALAEQPLGDPKMATANRAAAKVLKARMAQDRPVDYEALQKVKRAEIIVVQGSMDHVEHVLAAVGVEHLMVTPADLARIDLNAKQLVMVNCPGTMPPEAINKLRKFVRAGGFLYTTDWALKNVVEVAFPGFVKFNGRATSNDVVAIEVVKKDNVFLQHLKLSKESPKWWLEGSSYPIKVLKPESVEVLLTSAEMGTKYGDPAIAVTFPYGDGRVLHVASHFYLQQNETRTVAENKKGGKWLFEESNIDGKLAGGLSGDADVKAAAGGDIQSAYAAQQFTTNLVVERKKDQKRIDKIYSKRSTASFDFEDDSGAARKLKKGAKLKVVGKRRGKVKVRTMAGDEGWVDSVNVE